MNRVTTSVSQTRSESFLTLRNFETIARQTTIVGIASLGMTMIIISGGIDLSVGSTIALSTVVIAWMLQVLGSLVGALIMTVINSGCSQMGLPSWVQQIVTGGIIIVAVALDRLCHRRAA